MSSTTFDPNKIKVEDLFRAKEEHRRRLAKLPFEEKIKILAELQTSVSAAMKNERLTFESFLKVCPDFASEPIEEWDVVEEWYAKRGLSAPPPPFDKRPDVIARTVSGKAIGIELKSWVNREQITEARKQERIQENILKAIGKQPPNETRHIGYVRPFAKQVRFDSEDAPDFREEMFDLIQKEDGSWPQKPNQEQEVLASVRDFTGFPTLKKYLHSVEFHPRPHFDMEWIQFPTCGGFYSPDDMLETLSKALLAHSSDERYKDMRTRASLDEVYLLVHYDFKAFAYNTPFDAHNFGFKEAASFASKTLNGDGGNFDRVFLFHFLWDKEEAYRIF